MKPLYRNLFILFGVAAIVVMLLTFDMDYRELWENVRKAGWWFLAVMGLWCFIYLFNALSWYYIIRGGERPAPVSLRKVYKLSISGFALNYATPFGLMGGEPYRIMELTPVLGGQRATSCVILYVMTHIFTHICFWLGSAVLCLFVCRLTIPLAMLLALVGVFCGTAIWFFMQGYKKGMVVKLFRLLEYIPILGKRAARFHEKKREALHNIDLQIAALHNQKRSTFYMAFLMEFIARFLTCLEVFFILKILTPHVNFVDCILITAFTSLFSNIFFFSPMQLGAREGGFALAVGGLSLSGAFGVYASLITRVRELLWIAIGVLLMRWGNDKERKIITVRGLLLDFGGTLDTRGRHWARVLWEGYRKSNVPVNEEQFREAYVHGERYLAEHEIVNPQDNFLELLKKKINIELDYLVQAQWLKQESVSEYSAAIAMYCYKYARQCTEEARQTLEQLKTTFRIGLVSNFYGNLHCVLKDFGIDHCMDCVIESATTGVSKPDKAIWQLGIDALGLSAEDTCIVGDSFDKDVIPAKKLGCKTVWIKGEEWLPRSHDSNLPDAIITSINELKQLLKTPLQ